MKFLLLASFVLFCAASTVYRTRNISFNDDGSILITTPEGKRVYISRQVAPTGERSIDISISGPNIPAKTIQIADNINDDQTRGDNQWSSIDSLNEELRLKRGSTKSKSQGDILIEILREYQGVVDEPQYEKLLNKINKAVKKGEVSPQIYDLLENLDQQSQGQVYDSQGTVIPGQGQGQVSGLGSSLPLWNGRQYTPQIQSLLANQQLNGGISGNLPQGYLLGQYSQQVPYGQRQVVTVPQTLRQLTGVPQNIQQQQIGQGVQQEIEQLAELLQQQQQVIGQLGQQLQTRNIPLSLQQLPGVLQNIQQQPIGQGVQQGIGRWAELQQQQQQQQTVGQLRQQLQDRSVPLSLQQLIGVPQNIQQQQGVQQEIGQLAELLQQLQQQQQVIGQLGQQLQYRNIPLVRQQLTGVPQNIQQQQKIAQLAELLQQLQQQQQVIGQLGQQLQYRNVPLSRQQLTGVPQNIQQQQGIGQLAELLQQVKQQQQVVGQLGQQLQNRNLPLSRQRLTGVPQNIQQQPIEQGVQQGIGQLTELLQQLQQQQQVVGQLGQQQQQSLQQLTGVPQKIQQQQIEQILQQVQQPQGVQQGIQQLAELLQQQQQQQQLWQQQQYRSVPLSLQRLIGVPQTVIQSGRVNQPLSRGYLTRSYLNAVPQVQLVY